MIYCTRKDTDTGTGGTQTPPISVETGRWGVVMTLCQRCVQVFMDDPRYIITRVPCADPILCECDICTATGADYDVRRMNE